MNHQALNLDYHEKVIGYEGHCNLPSRHFDPFDGEWN
jgi:hypothetical protein